MGEARAFRARRAVTMLPKLPRWRTQAGCAPLTRRKWRGQKMLSQNTTFGNSLP